MNQGFYFDERACIGCRTCQVACIETHKLPREARFRRVWSYVTGTYPDASAFHLSLGCNHCAKPACVAACPQKAMYIDSEDGTVQHDDEKCIGCKTCVTACPYGTPQYREDIALVQKCDACVGYRAQGEDPVCVAACPMRAIAFGDVEELAKAHPETVSAIPVMPVADTTNPSLLMTVKQQALAEEPQALRL
ncbi:4Fe-4S dicluster domain-containing protein [Eggerthella sinensis]|uniref:4Fe-4S dicluster domain-containing protein n=1 Tax=Eggerthella sinensis TaxID=242230 RepID=UPI00248D71D1|nr:4Fe-4S dicluster domain-containing protein [Eggerthella sinensis]